MRTLFLLLLILSGSGLWAQKPGNSFKNPIIISHPDSVQYYEDQYISITGPVVSTKELMRPEGVIGYLNMFKPYPDNAFDITIFRKSMAFFAPLEQYEGKKIKITGKVTSFIQKNSGNKRYSIRLTNLKQLEVIEQ